MGDVEISLIRVANYDGAHLNWSISSKIRAPTYGLTPVSIPNTLIRKKSKISQKNYERFVSKSCYQVMCF